MESPGLPKQCLLVPSTWEPATSPGQEGDKKKTSFEVQLVGHPPCDSCSTQVTWAREGEGTGAPMSALMRALAGFSGRRRGAWPPHATPGQAWGELGGLVLLPLWKGGQPSGLRFGRRGAGSSQRQQLSQLPRVAAQSHLPCRPISFLPALSTALGAEHRRGAGRCRDIVWCRTTRHMKLQMTACLSSRPQ